MKMEFAVARCTAMKRSGEEAESPTLTDSQRPDWSINKETFTMGDKGGKKDKHKAEKQRAQKKKKENDKKENKQPKSLL